MTHPLDRPVWNALTTTHAHLAIGGALARRYAAGFTPLAAIADASAASLAELRELAAPRTVLAFATTEPLDPPDGFVSVATARFDQMLATSLPTPATMLEIVRLNGSDVPAMLALAGALLPNSFSERTHELGCHLGIRADARLVAMAGERLRFPGFAEISAVCTAPDWRGRGYAGALVASLGRSILDRGELPFLHVHGANQPAIAVYRRLGFTLRRVMHLTVLCAE